MLRRALSSKEIIPIHSRQTHHFQTREGAFPYPISRSIDPFIHSSCRQPRSIAGYPPPQGWESTPSQAPTRTRMTSLRPGGYLRTSTLLLSTNPLSTLKRHPSPSPAAPESSLSVRLAHLSAGTCSNINVFSSSQAPFLLAQTAPCPDYRR